MTRPIMVQVFLFRSTVEAEYSQNLESPARVRKLSYKRCGFGSGANAFGDSLPQIVMQVVAREVEQ